MGIKPAYNTDKRMFDDFRNGKLALFYRFVYPSLLLYARRYLHDTEEEYYAEDFVQNAVFNAWNNRMRFETLAGLKSFLYTSVRNESISHLRKLGARSRYVSQLADVPPDIYENLALEADLAGILYGVVQELPERERCVLEMSFFEGKSNIEIAAALNLSDSAVKKRKARGLDMLRRYLNPTFGIVVSR